MVDLDRHCVGTRENSGLNQDRESFRLRAWMDAYNSLSRANLAAPLAARNGRPAAID